MFRASVARRCCLLTAAGAALAAATLLTGASAAVNTSQSGWYSGNPLLGPNAIADLACAGATCYGSGAFGTVLKSTDGGASWTGIVTGITPDLPRVRLIGGSASKLVTGGGCVVRRSDDGGQTFTRLPFTASDRQCFSGVAALAFPSSDVGYLALSNGAVLSTADGGRTFSRKTAIPGGTVGDVLCLSDTMCLATAGGSIQRSTDGASSWTQVSSGGAPLNGLERADANTLYAVGNGLTVLKSVDAGATWTQKAVSGTPPGDLASIRCAGPSVCIAATRQGNQILRTTDGGDTFSSVVPSTDRTFTVGFASATRALAAGASGSAEVSDDAGETWRTVGSRIAGRFSVLAAGPGSVAYAGGVDGMLARSADSGQSWHNVSAPSDAVITSMAAPSANRLFVLSTDGSLQRSDNGGASYKLLNGGASALVVIATDNEHVLLIGPASVRRSTDGGETFASVADADLRSAMLFGADLAGNAVYAYGRRRLLVSTNAGASWKRVAVPRKLAISRAAFAGLGKGYLLDAAGRVWKTVTGGRSWQRLDAVGPSRVLAIDFSDARHGYAVVNRFETQAAGIVLRTSDGGASWHPQLVGAEPVRELRAGAGADYLLSGDSSLLATTTGGDIGTPQAVSLSVRRRALAKPATITVSGRLEPAQAGKEVSVAMKDRAWWAQTATVASNGSFSTRWRVRGRSLFVAQALGDADHAGGGTRPLVVDVAKRSR
jgi:photosystem II stability/assembly factor-like uncharacterized protein